MLWERKTRNLVATASRVSVEAGKAIYCTAVDLPAVPGGLTEDEFADEVKLADLYEAEVGFTDAAGLRWGRNGIRPPTRVPVKERWYKRALRWACAKLGMPP